MFLVSKFKHPLRLTETNSELLQRINNEIDASTNAKPIREEN